MATKALSELFTGAPQQTHQRLTTAANSALNLLGGLAGDSGTAARVNALAREAGRAFAGGAADEAEARLKAFAVKTVVVLCVATAGIAFAFNAFYNPAA